VARRLEILRDSRVGAYGAIGGTLLVITFYAALGELTGSLRGFALFAAPLFGRWSMVAAVVGYPYARAQGAASAFQRHRAPFIVASVVALMLLAVAGYLTLGYSQHAIIALVTTLAWVVAVTIGWTAWAARRLGGGLTGDTYGALNELVEVIVFLIVPVLWRFMG
jgi:cobalamin synthase